MAAAAAAAAESPTVKLGYFTSKLQEGGSVSATIERLRKHLGLELLPNPHNQLPRYGISRKYEGHYFVVTSTCRETVFIAKLLKGEPPKHPVIDETPIVYTPTLIVGKKIAVSSEQWRLMDFEMIDLQRHLAISKHGYLHAVNGFSFHIFPETREIEALPRRSKLELDEFVSLMSQKSCCSANYADLYDDHFEQLGLEHTGWVEEGALYRSHLAMYRDYRFIVRDHEVMQYQLSYTSLDGTVLSIFPNYREGKVLFLSESTFNQLSLPPPPREGVLVRGIGSTNQAFATLIFDYGMQKHLIPWVKIIEADLLPLESPHPVSPVPASQSASISEVPLLQLSPVSVRTTSFASTNAEFTGDD